MSFYEESSRKLLTVESALDLDSFFYGESSFLDFGFYRRYRLVAMLAMKNLAEKNSPKVNTSKSIA